MTWHLILKFACSYNVRRRRRRRRRCEHDKSLPSYNSIHVVTVVIVVVAACFYFVSKSFITLVQPIPSRGRKSFYRKLSSQARLYAVVCMSQAYLNNWLQLTNFLCKSAISYDIDMPVVALNDFERFYSIAFKRF
jgi:hypothetical protein